jgi:hypothetical protein
MDRNEMNGMQNEGMGGMKRRKGWNDRNAERRNGWDETKEWMDGMKRKNGVSDK